jgi:hypothetical protein
MNNKKVTFQQLRRVLLGLGYGETQLEDRVVFRHPDTELFVILPRLRPSEVVQPIDLLSVQNALANGGIVPKDAFESLFEREPLKLWHAIIDAEAEYLNEHGHPPTVLKLPVLQAYELAKLPTEQFGPLSEKVMQHGVKVFEKEGLLGIPVQLVAGAQEFIFE